MCAHSDGQGRVWRGGAAVETIIVPNVHEFPGHIACDVASNSEIVVPLFDGERLLGVLDLDSPTIGRFDDQDAEGLNELVTVFVAHEERLSASVSFRAPKKPQILRTNKKATGPPAGEYES